MPRHDPLTGETKAAKSSKLTPAKPKETKAERFRRLNITARCGDGCLDKLVVQTEVKRAMTTEEVEGPSREGALVHGLSLQVRP